MTISIHAPALLGHVTDMRTLGVRILFFVKEKRPVSKDTGRLSLAEGEGFEPSRQVALPTRFPSVLLQPLGHPSLQI